jgi:hypothetical protein
MSFDRIKPPDRRLLERPDERRPDSSEADPQGRAALFTRGGAPAQDLRHTPLGITVHCSWCGRTSPLDAQTALRSAVPLVLFAPWRSHPLFAVCPACHRRAWLRVQGAR